MKTYLITAAGGNGTAIRVLERPLTRDEYAREGHTLGIAYEPFGAEQAGFLIPSEKHFEMGGGEFCGNATRSAAVLLSELSGASDVQYTVSGYDGTVHSTVRKLRMNVYEVISTLPNLPTETTARNLSDGASVYIVDLGGIVQVVINGRLPSDYKSAHRSITRELGLESRAAVGVTWYKRDGNGVEMHPVVWVRDVDTFFYEQSCGSGTIAVASVTGIRTVKQPTGQSIEAHVSPEAVTLKSEMEITKEDTDA